MRCIFEISYREIALLFSEKGGAATSSNLKFVLGKVLSLSRRFGKLHFYPSM